MRLQDTARSGSTRGHPPPGAVPSDLPAPFQVTLPGGPDAAPDARAAVSDWIAGHVSATMLTDAHLLVAELVANSVRHQSARSDRRRRGPRGGRGSRDHRVDRAPRPGPAWAARRLRPQHRREAVGALGRQPRRRHPRVGRARVPGRLIDRRTHHAARDDEPAARHTPGRRGHCGRADPCRRRPRAIAGRERGRRAGNHRVRPPRPRARRRRARRARAQPRDHARALRLRGMGDRP
jgi:hypothetical protein